MIATGGPQRPGGHLMHHQALQREGIQPVWQGQLGVGARFDMEASFSRAVVERGFSMEHASFDGEARFSRTRFADMALVRWTTFRGDVSFQEAIFEDAVNFGRTQFHRTARFDRATLRRRPLLDQARAAAAGPHSWPSGVSPTRWTTAG